MSRSRPTDPTLLPQPTPVDDAYALIRERVKLLFQAGTVLFLCGAAVGYLFLDKASHPAYRDALVRVGPLAMATLLLVAAGIFAPDLVAPGRIAFPLNCTLPLVYAVMVRLSVILLTSQKSAVFPPFDPLVPALVWTRPLVLGIATLVQFVALSILPTASILTRPAP